MEQRAFKNPKRYLNMSIWSLIILENSFNYFSQMTPENLLKRGKLLDKDTLRN